MKIGLPRFFGVTIVSGDVVGLISAIDSADGTPEADFICLEAGTSDPTGYVSASCKYSGTICETLTPSPTPTSTP